MASLTSGHDDREAPGLPAWLVIAAAWSSYLPVGLQYLTYLGCGVAALIVLGRSRRLIEVRQHRLFLAALAFWCWMLVSATWSAAPMRDIVAHLWSYSLVLWLVPIALACQADAGRQALRHFVLVSAAVAGTIVAADIARLPDLATWWPVVGVTGNQRIASSLLLALALALAVAFALVGTTPRARAVWLAAAALCAFGIVLQDRRTGMLAAPLLMAVLAVAWQPNWPRRMLLATAIAAAAALVTLSSNGVQRRFAEGLSELRSYPSQGDVATSWGMRLRMLEVTGTMILERPLAGWGAGSWPTEWRRRVDGGPLLAGHSTPHSELLLVTVQAGVPGLLLWLAVMGIALQGTRLRSWRPPAAMLVWSALLWAAIFNASLRDVKFALPMLTLAAVAAAAQTGPPRRTTAGAAGGSSS